MSKNNSLVHSMLAANAADTAEAEPNAYGTDLATDPVFHFSVAKHLYEYSWPSCFLLSYICEPIFLVGMFYVLGKHLVRTQPHLKGIHADLCLIPQPMDLS